jgi:peptidylprolyl isomerase
VAEASAAKRDRNRRTAVRIAVAAVIVLAVLFGVSTLMGDDSEPERAGDTSTETTEPDVSTPETTAPAYSDPEVAAEVLAREAPDTQPPPADTAKDALVTTTLIEGTGDAAVAASDTVTVMYTGKLSDGTVFDSSWERAEPATFGLGEVITGWGQGLVGAKIGERRHLVIGSDLAYGAQGRPPQIPADAPLAFDVDIVDIQPAAG